jgi:protein SCO1/2
MKTRHHTFIVALLLLGLTTVDSVKAQKSPGTEVLENVNVLQKLNTTLPMDLELRNSNGKMVTLDDLITDRPVILSFVYYECPQLCTLTLNGVVKAVNAMNLKVGEDYDLISISFDEKETVEMAEEKRAAYAKQSHKGRTDKYWHFLTADKEAIASLTDAAGYSFQYIPETDEYAHSSAIMVVTPEGKLSKYFYGIEFSARDLRLALVDASEKKIGTPVDAILLWCFHYDPMTGKYGLSIMRTVRAGGALTVGAMLSFIAVMIRRDRIAKVSKEA